MGLEMCEEPHTEEDAPVGSSLRRSSQKAVCDAMDSIALQVKEGLARKSVGQVGPKRGRPLIPQSGGTSNVRSLICPSFRF